MSKLLSIVEAAALGIGRLRMPQWVDPNDYLKIDIVDGKPGPWGHLYSPINELVNGRNPVDLLLVGYTELNEKRFVEAPMEKDK